ncbi:MAG: transcription termination factor Rho [bacterium]
MNLNTMSLTELRELAKKKNVKSIASYKKIDLLIVVKKILEDEKLELEKSIDSIPTNTQESTQKNKVENYIQKLDSGVVANGILEVLNEGYGFLRHDNYLSSANDIYVSPTQIRRFNLKTGDQVTGNLRIPKDNEKFSALLYLNTVNNDSPASIYGRPNFESLTPIYPEETLTLEISQKDISSRIIDIICPIGKGQRGLIVAPPKTGKTTLLKSIANSIIKNHPEIYLIVLLIDERPEEVTDIKKSIFGKNIEIIYSTFDEQPDHHKRVAEMVLERGKRLAEQGKDLVILLDSITRLSRAYNLTMPSSGRTLSGGLDPATLYMPKKFFGAARNIEEGGSLTILATALVETGSKMDDIIFEEFKGTGNMELVLDRKLAEKRIFPAIDVLKSSTRKEELLLDAQAITASYNIRKMFSNNQSQNLENTEKILNSLKSTKNNVEFINILNKNS